VGTATRLRVLVSAPYMIPELDRFRVVFDTSGIDLVIPEVKERLSESALMTIAGTIDGAICGDDPFTPPVLQAAAPRLRVISKWGTGVDSIDRQEASRLGIQVFNTPGAFTEAVADSVMGYILAFARRIPWADREIKAGNWIKLPSRALHECVLGVIGVGKIGKAVLRRGLAFGMRPLGNDILPVDPAFVHETGAALVPLDQLLDESDFVSVNCDLNPSSLRLLDRVALAHMKSSAVLINTARGPVVDEPALVDSLREGRIAGAALDVFEEEPLPASSPLRSFDNVLLSPHNANSSPGAWERVHQSTIENLFRGLGLPMPVGGFPTVDPEPVPGDHGGVNR
jgi:D-3-phosphoglycerate dehydrogenase / 2-oxoglutarate reductase